MTIRLQRKRPEEALTYTHNWAPFLGDDTIASQTTTGSGVTVSDVSAASQAVTFKLSGGTLGTSGTVTQTITTAAGLIETETFTIRIGADEPISLAEAKAYLRLFANDEDAKIEAMIPRARQWVEDHTGLALVRRAFTERLRPKHGAIRLSKGPLVSVESVDYTDASGAATYEPRFWAPDAILFPVSGESWPSLASDEAFTIEYTAGFADGELDERLIGAMYALIEGEYSEGYAYPQRATDAAERCCAYLRQMVA